MCFVKGGNNSFGNLFSDHKINDDILMRFLNLYFTNERTSKCLLFFYISAKLYVLISDISFM